MHYSLKPEDRAKIKRAIPSVNNKIIIAAVARLYIAFPNPNEWKFTGLSGAIVLAKDLIAHTYFLKLVDVTGTGHVLWDQELWPGFEYHQDRTFFHTFEVEGYMAGLSFTEESEGKLFFKAVNGLELGVAPPGTAHVAYLPPSRAIQAIESISSQRSMEKKDFLKAGGFQRFSKWARNIFAKAPSKLVKLPVHNSITSTPNRPAPELPPRNCRRLEIRNNASNCGTQSQDLSMRQTISDKPPPLPPRPPVASSPPLPPLSPVHVDSRHPVTTGENGRGMLLESIRNDGLGSLRKAHSPQHLHEGSVDARRTSMIQEGNAESPAQILKVALAQRKRRMSQSDSEESSAEWD